MKKEINNTELFDLSKTFSLSGNQPVKVVKFKPLQIESRLFTWKAQYNPEELLKNGLITEQEYKNWR